MGFKLYTTKDGLLSNQIWKIKQDPKGYLWLGTPEGCSRFDGEEFINFTKSNGLSTTQVWDFAFFSDTVFILQNNGIDIIVNNKITDYIMPNQLIIKGDCFLYYNGDACIYCTIEKSNQRLIYNLRKNQKVDAFDNILKKILSPSGIMEFDKRFFISIDEGKYLRFISIELNSEGNYDTLNQNKITYFNTLIDEISEFPNRKITLPKEYPDKIVGNNFFFDLDQNLNLKIGKKRYIIIRDKRIFLLTDNKITKISFDFYNTFSSIKANDGTIWIATDRGLVKLFAETILNYPYYAGYVDYTWSIFPETESRLWLGGFNKGLFCYENGKCIKSINSINAKEIFSPYYGSEKGFKNDMVIPTGHKGLFVYDFDTDKYRIIRCKRNDDAFFVWKDTIDKKILTGRNTAYCLNEDYSFDSLFTIDSEERLQRINAATRRANNYYFSTGNNILEFNMLNKEQRWLNFKDIRFNSISCDYQQNLWAASDEGIFVMTPKDTMNWLKEQHFWALIIDKKNRLFSVSKDGLYVLDLNEYYKSGYAQFFHFGEDEGFYGAGDENAFYLDEAGKIWLPGASNNVVIYPDELNLKVQKLKTNIVIAECISDSNNLSINSFTDNLGPYKNKDFYFEFHSVCLTSPSKVMYQYRLKGYDTKWSEPTKIRNIRYTNIPHGDYSFEVRAALYNQFDDAEISSISFTVASPFWFKWWFISLAIIFLIFLIILIIRWRIKVANKHILIERKIQQLEMEVLQMQIKPHFIGNSLELIRNYITTENYDKSLIAIQSFGTMLRNVTQNINQSFISLKQEIEIIENYLIFQKLRFEDKFEYKLPIKNCDLLNEIEVPPLILQPFIENSIVHGFQSLKMKGLLTIDYFLNNGNISIVIIDNGVGRKHKVQNKDHKSVGITNSIDRLKLYENSIPEPVLIFDLEQGTKVEIKLKI
ncbi:MAG: histidine kinase [Saprospiraceae bacterium]|nr:histidine kinase [Saprospiraceae bacterium]